MVPKIYVHGSTVVLTHGSQCRVFARQGAERLTLDMDGGAHVAQRSTHGASGLVLAAAFSRSGELFALTTDCKQLLVFATDTWRRTHEFRVAKKGVVLLFPADDGSVLVADKFGDVYRYSLAAAAGTVSERLAGDDAAAVAAPDGSASCGGGGRGELVLGHLSMILDAAFLGDGRYLATGDRDEKIRVTRYPQSYDIQSYCLGHTKMVTRLLPLPLAASEGGDEPPELLLSGGADGSVRLWDYSTGAQLACVGAASLPQPPAAGDAAIVSSLHWMPGRRTAIVTFEGDRLLVALRVVAAAAEEEATAAAVASPGRPSLRCVQTIVLDAAPWCVHTSGESGGMLLVLQPLADRPLLAFAFGGAGDEALCEVAPQVGAADWLGAALRDEWPSLLESSGGGSGGSGEFYAKLEKMGVDNLPDYLHKKKERLRVAKEKREGPQQPTTAAEEAIVGEPGNDGPPPAKLCKSEAAA